MNLENKEKTYEELEEDNKQLRIFSQDLLDQLFQIEKEKIKLEEFIKYGYSLSKN